MKRLVIKEYKSLFSRKTKYIKIVEQTHKGSEFGINGNEFEHNGFTIVSSDNPELLSDTLYVRGYDSGNDLKLVDSSIYSKHIIKKIREAIKAYNEYFSNCNNCIDRKCNQCIKNK